MPPTHLDPGVGVRSTHRGEAQKLGALGTRDEVGMHAV
jgi:hypothetical protein